MALRKGSKVSWTWGKNIAHGKVVDKFTEKVTRDASEDEPAYLIEQEDGDQVLKSASELTHD